jgi:hypothetical protein
VFQEFPFVVYCKSMRPPFLLNDFDIREVVCRGTRLFVVSYFMILASIRLSRVKSLIFTSSLCGRDSGNQKRRLAHLHGILGLVKRALIAPIQPPVCANPGALCTGRLFWSFTHLLLCYITSYTYMFYI